LPQFVWEHKTQKPGLQKENKRINKLEKKPQQPRLVFMQVFFPGRIGIWSVGFLEGGKPENPERKPRRKARTNNKRNPHVAPGQNRSRVTLGGGRALSPLCHPCSLSGSWL